MAYAQKTQQVEQSKFLDVLELSTHALEVEQLCEEDKLELVIGHGRHHHDYCIERAVALTFHPFAEFAVVGQLPSLHKQPKHIEASNSEQGHKQKNFVF